MSSITKNTASAVLVIMLTAFSQALFAAGGKQQGKSSPGNPVTDLDTGDRIHLIFLREEEKLARDVYITLGSRFPELKVFGKIDDAEQRHTCAVCDKLEKYGVDDPSTNDNVGVFTGEEFGEYFTRKYTELTERGSKSLLDALYVGAYIEETDMVEINYCPLAIIERIEYIHSEADCGYLHTEAQDIQRLYGSLLRGSENHLRAFVRNIERHIGEGAYQAQILQQAQVDEILAR